MNYDIPKVPKEPTCVIEKSFVAYSETDKAKNDPFHIPSQQSESFGGHFGMTASGTATGISNPSPSAPPDEYVYFIPEVGVIPEEEMQKQQNAKNMEQAVELERTA